MSFSLSLHFLPVLSLQCLQCLLDSEVLSCFSGVIMSIRSFFLLWMQKQIFYMDAKADFYFQMIFKERLLFMTVVKHLKKNGNQTRPDR